MSGSCSGFLDPAVDELTADLICQAPALVVLCVLTTRFLKHIEGIVGRMSDALDRNTETISRLAEKLED